MFEAFKILKNIARGRRFGRLEAILSRSFTQKLHGLKKIQLIKYYIDFNHKRLPAVWVLDAKTVINTKKSREKV